MMYATILAALLKLGATSDVAPEVATAVVKYARSADEAAFLLSWGTHETHFARRLIDGDCKRWECDHGRARGAWQLHAGAAGADWARLPGDIDLQTSVAAKMTRWAFRVCKTPLGAFRALGGLACDRPLRGEQGRIADFERARRELTR